jgi:hypothetical protein
MLPRTICPRCGGLLRTKRDGIFRWRYCPRTKLCGWDVFNHDPAQADPTAPTPKGATK